MSRVAPARRFGVAVHVFRVVLLVTWAAASFGIAFFARDLEFLAAGWPVIYWMAAQGSVLVFLGVVIVYAVVMNRIDPPEPSEEEDHG